MAYNQNDLIQYSSTTTSTLINLENDNLMEVQFLCEYCKVCFYN